MHLPTHNIVDLDTMKRDIANGEPAENYIEIDPEYSLKNKNKNLPCPCGSGFKFKKCCMANYRIALHKYKTQDIKNKTYHDVNEAIKETTKEQTNDTNNNSTI